MSTPHFNITVAEDGESTISFVHDGDLITIPNGHPNFARIAHALINGQDPAPFIDITLAVDGLSDRVTVTDDTVYFDGEPVHSRLAETILRYTAEGRDASNLIRFLERLQANPSYRSREQLWAWVSDRDLTIDSEGRIVGWKGVSVVAEGADEEGNVIERYTSVSTGTAWVNGEKHTGHIPNFVGAVVTIPREQVTDDPNVGCGPGLHVGSYSYAKGFGQKLLEVAFGPEDVVSVPADSAHQKLRCTRYEVLAVHENPDADLSHWEPEASWDDDDAWEALEEAETPASFLDRLRRWSGKQ